jgi:hypothetical protein
MCGALISLGEDTHKLTGQLIVELINCHAQLLLDRLVELLSCLEVKENLVLYLWTVFIV